MLPGFLIPIDSVLPYYKSKQKVSRTITIFGYKIEANAPNEFSILPLKMDNTFVGSSTSTIISWLRRKPTENEWEKRETRRHPSTKYTLEEKNYYIYLTWYSHCSSHCLMIFSPISNSTSIQTFCSHHCLKEKFVLKISVVFNKLCVCVFVFVVCLSVQLPSFHYACLLFFLCECAFFSVFSLLLSFSFPSPFWWCSPQRFIPWYSIVELSLFVGIICLLFRKMPFFNLFGRRYDNECVVNEWMAWKHHFGNEGIFFK